MVAVEVPCSHLPSREPDVKKVVVDGLQIQHRCTCLIVQAEVFISLGGPKQVVSMMGVHWPSYSPDIPGALPSAGELLDTGEG